MIEEVTEGKIALLHSQTCSFSQILEEFLVEYKGHTADLFDFGFCCSIAVDEVCGDGNCQLAAELFSAKTYGTKKTEQKREETQVQVTHPDS